MSKTASALLVKFLFTTVAAAIAFRSLGSTWGWILTLGVAAAALNYLLGDLAILPSLGKVWAAVADGGLAALTAYLIDRLTPAFRTTGGSLILFAVLIAVAEYFFHNYLRSTRKVAP